MRKIAAHTLFAFLLSTAASRAETISKWGMYAGFRIDYRVVLPNGYNPARAYPAVLVLPDGSEDLAAVEADLNKYWRTEAERRGYIVISPAAFENQKFEADAADIFPEFLDQMLHNYKIPGRKFHLAGAGNGGIAAFRLAAELPKYFWSVTGLPGYLTDELSTFRPFRPMCIFMEVGAGDTEWFHDITNQAAAFRESGLSVNVHVDRDQGHVLNLDDAGIKRLFDDFDRSASGCGP